jgi:hypothetical protein
VFVGRESVDKQSILCFALKIAQNPLLSDSEDFLKRRFHDLMALYALGAHAYDTASPIASPPTAKTKTNKHP